jgi:hypothetical protein
VALVARPGALADLIPLVTTSDGVQASQNLRNQTTPSPNSVIAGHLALTALTWITQLISRRRSVHLNVVYNPKSTKKHHHDAVLGLYAAGCGSVTHTVCGVDGIVPFFETYLTFSVIDVVRYMTGERSDRSATRTPNGCGGAKPYPQLIRGYSELRYVSYSRWGLRSRLMICGYLPETGSRH